MNFNCFHVTLEFSMKDSSGAMTGGTCGLYIKTLKSGEEAYRAIEKYLYHTYFPSYPHVEFGPFSYTSVDTIPDYEIVKEV